MLDIRTIKNIRPTRLAQPIVFKAISRQQARMAFQAETPEQLHKLTIK